MDRILDIIGLLGLPAVIATMLLAHMKRRGAKRDDGKAQLGDGKSVPFAVTQADPKDRR